MKLLGEELNLTSITSCWVIHVWPEVPWGFLGRTSWNHSQIDPHFESVSKRELLEANLLAEEFSGDTESKWVYGSQVHISFLGFGMKLQCGFVRTSERNILLNGESAMIGRSSKTGARFLWSTLEVIYLIVALGKRKDRSHQTNLVKTGETWSKYWRRITG